MVEESEESKMNYYFRGIIKEQEYIEYDTLYHRVFHDGEGVSYYSPLAVAE